MDLDYDAGDVVARLKELTVEEYSETKIDKDDSDPPLLFAFGKDINNKLVYVKLKIKGGKAMEEHTLLRKIHMDCPLCDKTHEVEERKRFATITLKGDEVTYEERFYFCANTDKGENEFESGLMVNENLLNARNAYRVKHGLLTSNEIVAIRGNYGLSQVDLAKLLGWGEATVSRYESKAIQDGAYDTMLRQVKDNPLQALELLKKNADKFSDLKR